MKRYDFSAIQQAIDMIFCLVSIAFNDMIFHPRQIPKLITYLFNCMDSNMIFYTKYTRIPKLIYNSLWNSNNICLNIWVIWLHCVK